MKTIFPLEHASNKPGVAQGVPEPPCGLDHLPATHNRIARAEGRARLIRHIRAVACAVSKCFTPSSTARRKTAGAASRSRGGPKTPGRGSCIAPEPTRDTMTEPRET